MLRTTESMHPISAALHDLRAALEGLVSDHHHFRQQLEGMAQRASFGNGATVKRRGRPPGRMARAGSVSAPNGAPAKRGRKFKFTDAQAAEFRAQVEGGKSAVGLAKELKVSLPTMYNTLKRAGWGARRGRLSARAARVPGRSGGPKKRGRAFKFSDDQAAGFRKRVESGETATALAKELKISLPTIYNTLKRAGWTGRKGRKAKAA